MGKVINFYPVRNTILNVLIKSYSLDAKTIRNLGIASDKDLHTVWDKHIEKILSDKRNAKLIGSLFK